MKITKTTATKIILNDLENLDPIAVYLEDTAPGAGKITITCFNDSWSYFWGGMGKDRKLAEFFCSCDNGYLAGKLAPQTDSQVDVEDPEECRNHAYAYVIEHRKNTDYTKERARELWEKIEHAYFPLAVQDQDFAYELYGDEWWYCTPKEPNHQYEYLCRIINAVKEGLKTIKDGE